MIGGVAEAGQYGIAVAKLGGLAIANEHGLAVGSHVQAKDGATAVVYAFDGVGAAGADGATLFLYWGAVAKRRRWLVAYAGEDGVEPNRLYRVKDGKVVIAE
jgi:hypothetical protein